MVAIWRCHFRFMNIVEKKVREFDVKKEYTNCRKFFSIEYFISIVRFIQLTKDENTQGKLQRGVYFIQFKGDRLRFLFDILIRCSCKFMRIYANELVQ